MSFNLYFLFLSSHVLYKVLKIQKEKRLQCFPTFFFYPWHSLTIISSKLFPDFIQKGWNWLNILSWLLIGKNNKNKVSKWWTVNMKTASIVVTSQQCYFILMFSPRALIWLFIYINISTWHQSLDITEQKKMSHERISCGCL